MTTPEISRLAFDAFRDDAAAPPPLTLRGGNEVDSYNRPGPFDPELDAPTDQYLEQFTFWGLGYLDARSWRHYLPRLIDYALRRPDDPAMAVEALVRSLRPPDRYPPRLASLTEAQETAVRVFLEAVALGDPPTAVRDDAQQALEEWWLPNPRARPTAADLAVSRERPIAYREVRDDAYRLIVPDTLTGSGVRDIPSESRRVQTWGGYLCGDVHTVVAVNVTPLALRSLDDAVTLYARFFEVAATPRPIDVSGARRAVRLDGLSPGNSPADPQALIMIVAEADEQVTLTIRTWERDDVRAAIERIAGSFGLSQTAT